MAKKRKQKEIAQEEIKLPEFDDDAFMKEETRAAWTSFIGIGYGFVCGIVSFAVFALLGGMWQLGLAFGVVLIFGNIGLFKLFKMDFSALTWKNYVGTAAFYAVTWLLVFIILINTPFYDNQAPVIQKHRLFIETSPGQWQMNDTDGRVIPAGHNVSVTAVITDNNELERIDLAMSLNGKPMSGLAMSKVDSNMYNYSGYDYTRYHGHIYNYKLVRGQPGEYNYTITASDADHHKATVTGSFTINVLD